ncbi:hypothetical protein PQX77_020289, partial [Marasmius sp. AFHP31]
LPDSSRTRTANSNRDGSAAVSAIKQDSLSECHLNNLDPMVDISTIATVLEHQNVVTVSADTTDVTAIR